MLDNYSIVKVSSLTERELMDIEGMNSEYLEENFDSTNYKLFSSQEKAFYRDLSRYMLPIDLKTPCIDFEKIKRNYLIPPQYKPYKLYKKGHHKYIEFESPEGRIADIHMNPINLREHFVRTIFKEKLIARIEPLFVFPEPMGEELARRQRLVNINNNVVGGYFYIPRSCYLSIAKECKMTIESSLLYPEPHEEILFHTFTSSNLKDKEEQYD